MHSLKPKRIHTYVRTYVHTYDNDYALLMKSFIIVLIFWMLQVTTIYYYCIFFLYCFCSFLYPVSSSHYDSLKPIADALSVPYSQHNLNRYRCAVLVQVIVWHRRLKHANLHML